MPLGALARELKDATERVVQLEKRLSPETFTRRPVPKSWSPAECIEHLNLTTRAYLPLIDTGLAALRTKNQASSGPYRMEWNARLLRWFLEPPVRMRTRTSAPFQPANLSTAARIVPDFIDLQAQLLKRLQLSEGLALDRYRIASPFASNVHYNLYSAFVLIAVHERRHLWQAERAASAILASEPRSGKQ